MDVYLVYFMRTQNALGNWSSKLYALSLLASGQSSTVTGTYAGQYIMQVFNTSGIIYFEHFMLD